MFELRARYTIVGRGGSLVEESVLSTWFLSPSCTNSLEVNSNGMDFGKLYDLVCVLVGT